MDRFRNYYRAQHSFGAKFLKLVSLGGKMKTADYYRIRASPESVMNDYSAQADSDTTSVNQEQICFPIIKPKKRLKRNNQLPALPNWLGCTRARKKKSVRIAEKRKNIIRTLTEKRDHKISCIKRI